MNLNKRLTRFLSPLIVAAAALAVAAPAASADTQQLKFRFDDGRVSIGQFKGEHVVDPSVTGLATLFGIVNTDTGAFAAPSDGLFIPSKTMENVETGVMPVDVVAEFHAAGTIFGNYNAETGVMQTEGADITAVLSAYNAGGSGNEAQLLARCVVTPVPVLLSTTGSLVDDSDPVNPISYDASPFAPRGAGVATWPSLPASTPAGGAYGSFVCPMVDQVAAGPGGLWLAGDAEISPLPASADIPATAPQPKAKAKAKKCKRNQRKVKRKCVKKRPKRK